MAPSILQAQADSCTGIHRKVKLAQRLVQRAESAYYILYTHYGAALSDAMPSPFFVNRAPLGCTPQGILPYMI
jgi:hypothetical protein